MTNKETATMLKSIRGLFSVSYSPESIVALSKAIELIEQMPDEHGDLIDRGELRKMKVFSQEFNRYVVPMMYIEEAKPIIAAERKDDGK